MNDPRDPAGRLLLAAVALFAAARGAFLVYPDLNLSYPFMAPDSYDWIANGLAWRGRPVAFSLRPPALPLVVAGLDAAGLLSLLPVLGQCALVLLIALNHSLLAPRFGRAAAALVTLILFADFFLQDLALYVLADIYAALLILAGVARYVDAERDERRYAAASIFLTASLLFQYAAVAVAPALVLHWLIRRRSIRPATLLYALVPPAVLLGGWALFKARHGMGAFRSGVQQVELVAPHAGGVFFYLLNTASVLGLPAFLLLAAGAAAAPRAREGAARDFLLLNALLAASWAAFWAFLYTWNDKRFVLYLLFFLLPFLAHAFRGALEWAGRRGAAARLAVAALAAAAVAGAYLPYETCLTYDMLALTRTAALRFPSSRDPRTGNAAVSPWPPRLVRGPRGSSPLDLRRLREMRRGVDRRELARLHSLRDALAGRPPGPLCVHYENPDPFAWYIEKNRYGNLLGRTLVRGPACGAPELEIVDGTASLPRAAEGGGHG